MCRDIAIADLTESTEADFRRLYDERFTPSSNEDVVSVIMANPMRAVKRETGRIAYRNGDVVAIQGVLPRRAYWRQKELLVANVAVMAVRKDADRTFLTDFLRDAVEGFGADLVFGNSAIGGSRKRLIAAIGIKDGPQSCTWLREMDLRPGEPRIWRKLRGVRRRMGLIGKCEFPALPSDAELDIFWRTYLEGNCGLVSSRTARELHWVFDHGLKSRDVVPFALRESGRLVAYAFFRRTDRSGACWRVVDMIALGNDLSRLERLLTEAADFLKAHAGAEYVQITGYPDGIQPLLERLFPRASSFGMNKCIWKCLNSSADSLCGNWMRDAGSWFGCPYDGDMCLI